MLDEGVGILGEAAGRRFEHPAVTWTHGEQGFHQLQGERSGGLDQVRVVVGGEAVAALGQRVADLVRGQLLHRATDADESRKQEQQDQPSTLLSSTVTHQPTRIGSLQATVAYYNEHAANGADPLFHKAEQWLKPIDKPPYALVSYCPQDVKYALGENPGYLMFTLGGLETRPTGEVLTAQGEIIPGLYAAGRTTAGIPRTAKGYASGMSVGDATFFGRKAGRQAAANEFSS